MTLLLKQYVAIAIGGALGSISRFSLARWVQTFHHWHYPWGIWVVNVTGCLAIGILMGLFMDRVLLNPEWQAGLIIGVLGGFTTFSSFSLDTVLLFQSGNFLLALSNIFLTVIGCLLATAMGLFLIRAFV